MQSPLFDHDFWLRAIRNHSRQTFVSLSLPSGSIPLTRAAEAFGADVLGPSLGPYAVLGSSKAADKYVVTVKAAEDEGEAAQQRLKRRNQIRLVEPLTRASNCVTQTTGLI